MKDECVPMGDRLREHAAAHPDEVAVRVIWGIDEAREITWGQLNNQSDIVAASLLAAGAEDRPATVLLMTRDAVEHAVGAFGAWKVGLSVLPLTPSVGAVEGTQIIRDLDRVILIGEGADWAAQEQLMSDQAPVDEEALAAVRRMASTHVVADPMLVIASSGSTGVPKLIDVFGKGCFVPGSFLGGLGNALGKGERRRSLVCSPLNHGAGSAGMYVNLFDGAEVTSLARFDPDVALWAIKEYRFSTVGLVPTMMARMMESPRFDIDHLGSLTSLSHTGGICSPDVKMAWIEMLGAEKITEIYGSTESVGHTVITGTEWLTHRGSQGKPVNCELTVMDEKGRRLPTGEVGEVFMRPLVASVDVAHKYVNPSLKMKTRGDLVSIGDLGYLDDEGYLYVVGRVDDMIITGGANVYPDEVEIVIRSLAQVEDCVVVPRSHADLGQAVHAVVSLRPDADPLTPDDIIGHLAGQLTPYKVPRSVEIVDQIERTEAGKVRRKRYATGSSES